MSFLGSLLSDISGDKSHQSTGKPVHIIPQPRSTGSSSDRPTTPASSRPDASKRKNSGLESSSVPTKWSKLGGGSAAPSGPDSAFPADKASKPQGLGALTGTPLKMAPSTKQTFKKPEPKAAPPAASAAKAVAAAPPKKGSFRDLMERGKRAHEAQKGKGLGQIRHKEVPKHTRRERLKLALAEKQKANAQGQIGLRASAPSSRPGSSQAQNVKKTPPSASTPKKPERQPLEYKGTMRSQPLNKAKNSATSNRTGQGRRLNLDEYETEDGDSYDDGYEKRYRYAGSSQDDDEDDESDDMAGGGFDELEAEEEASLRAARKEDAEALRQEELHRTEKMARKEKLDELRRARAAKGR